MKTSTRILAASLFFLSTGCALHAAPPSARLEPPPAPLIAPLATPSVPSASGLALEAALETVNADEIRSDLFFIASDELEGRDTPSAGLKIAARYLRARLQRLGWKPGGPDGYFYTWYLESAGIDPAKCSLAFEGEGAKQSFVLGKDYYLGRSFPAIEAGAAHGAVVCVGEGKKDELEKLDLHGRCCLVFDHGQNLREARSTAAKGGAVALLVVPASDYTGETYDERFGKDLESQKKGSPHPAPDKEKPDNKEKDGDKASKGEDERRAPAIPSLYLKPAAKDQLLAAAHKTEAALKTGDELALTLNETRGLAGEDDGRIPVENVCGFWPGSDPVLSKEVVLVTAHYDHVGIMRGKIYNGADDNGSGTCTLMALAEGLRQYGPMRRSVMLMWVCGEEKGLWGSEAWNKHPFLPDGCKAVADINIDMVGRNAPEKLLITPTEKHKSFSFLTKVAERYAPMEGFHGKSEDDPALGSADDYWTRSDHYNFVKAGIPACFLFSDVHEDYHKPTDKPEKIDYDKIKRVSRLVLRMLDGLQGDKIDG